MRYGVMVMIFIACAVVLCNASFIVCMEKEPQIIATNDSELELFDYIMNAPYKSIHYDHAIPLQSAQIVKPDFKSFVCTAICALPDYERMKKLYDQASRVIDLDLEKHHKQANDFYKMLEACSNACNEAKRYGINEDQLAVFAFKQQGLVGSSSCKTALLFNVLKHYNQTLAADGGGEKIPLFTLSALAQSLDLSVDMFENQPYGTQALKILAMDVCAVKNAQDFVAWRLATWLYSERQRESNNNTSIVLDSEWKKLFLHKAFNFICLPFLCSATLRSILEMIDLAKNNSALRDERELGYYALEYKTTLLDSLRMDSVNICYDNKKEEISIVCALIEKYNRTRGLKRTPTIYDCDCYSIVKDTHISLPDHFSSECIAFKEYDQLIAGITNLRNSHNNIVQQCVNQLYPV